MPNLPTLTPSEIEAELKGTEYEDADPLWYMANDMESNKGGVYAFSPYGCANIEFVMPRNGKRGKAHCKAIEEAIANAARVIRLARENEDLRAKLQAQHQATWAMAIKALANKVNALDNTHMKQHLVSAHISTIPCPPLETKGE